MSKQDSNSLSQKSTTELQDIVQKVLSLAKAKGATDAATAANHDRGFSVDVRMGEVETVAFSEDKGVSVTVYVGQKKGSASGTDLTDESLKLLVDNAYEIALVSAEDPCFGLAESDILIKKSMDLDLYHPWNIEPLQAIEKAKTIEKAALAYDKRIVNSDGVHVSTYEFFHAYANSHGAIGTVSTTRQNLSCSLIAKDKKSMQRDYDYTTARQFSALTDDISLAESAALRTVNRLNARKIKTGNYPVVFSSRISSGLFSTFIGAISGSNLYRKSTFLLDSIGQKVFPDFVRVYEQPHIMGALGSGAFDDEGVMTRPNVMVDNGIVQQYVLGSYSARRMGLKTTANSGGVHNLTIDSTGEHLSDILKSMGTGLLVTELMGQGINLITGDYSRGASGFWVENGEIKFPVEEITIAGNLRDMFKNIRAIGCDINPNIATKVGSVLIDSMMIAGD